MGENKILRTELTELGGVKDFGVGWIVWDPTLECDNQNQAQQRLLSTKDQEQQKKVNAEFKKAERKLLKCLYQKLFVCDGPDIF